MLLLHRGVHFTSVAFVLHLLLMLFLAAICTRKLHQLGRPYCLPLPVALANPVALAEVHLNGFWLCGGPACSLPAVFRPDSESCSIV